MLKKLIPLVLSVVCVAQLSAATPAISTQEMAQATAIAKDLALEVSNGTMTADQALTEVQAAAEGSTWTLTDKDKKILVIAGIIFAALVVEEVVLPLTVSKDSKWNCGYIRKGAINSWNWAKGLFSSKKDEEKKGESKGDAPKGDAPKA